MGSLPRVIRVGCEYDAIPIVVGPVFPTDSNCKLKADHAYQKVLENFGPCALRISLLQQKTKLANCRCRYGLQLQVLVGFPEMRSGLTMLRGEKCALDGVVQVLYRCK